MKKKKTITIDIGKVDKRWEYSSNPRLEGLLKMVKYINWTNINKKSKGE
jgi:hypothetical protein